MARLLGGLGKLSLVLGLMLLAGIGGWYGGKIWINQLQNRENQSFGEHTSSGNELQQISEEEWQRRTSLRARRLELGVDYDFYHDLVNQVFWQEYPSQTGKILTNSQEDQKWRERWDEVAAHLLEQLSLLDKESRRALGSYEQQQHDRWVQQVNFLHLSSSAFYDLIDAQFSYLFPELEQQVSSEQPIGQIWSAIAFQTLAKIQSYQSYEPIVFNSNSMELSGTLEPGEGKAYIVRLKEGQYLDFRLSSIQLTGLSIYSPTGQFKLLEDSSKRHWIGILPESGFYEIVIVSRSKANLDYTIYLIKEQQ